MNAKTVQVPLNVYSVNVPTSRLRTKSRIISVILSAFFALSISGCGSTPELGSPAGRAVETGAPVTGTRPSGVIQGAPVSQAGGNTTQDPVKQLRQYEDLQNEIRDLRRIVEQQQFEIERLEKGVSGDLNRLNTRIAAQENLIAVLQTQRETETPGYPIAPQGQTTQSNIPGSYIGQTNNQNQNSTIVRVEPTDDSGTMSPDNTSLGTTQTRTGVVRPSSGNAAGVTPPVVSNTANTTTTIPTQPPSTTGGTGISAPIATQSSVTPVDGINVSSAGRDQYDAAFEMLKQNRYDEAIAGFQNFLTKHGNTNLADDAQYWIGEAHYVTRDFTSAVTGFQQVISRFPDSSRTPRALLKIGYIQYETGDFPAARTTLTQVQTRYPNDQVAASAASRLERMTAEGH